MASTTPAAALLATTTRATAFTGYKTDALNDMTHLKAGVKAPDLSVHWQQLPPLELNGADK